MRLNKYIGDAGYCSRREADRLIEAGKVAVNGKTALVGMQVKEGDTVTVDGVLVGRSETDHKIIYAFYKPRGVVCTMADEPDSLFRFLKNRCLENPFSENGFSARVYPIGRLDKDSDGLVLLTNDGELTNRILKTADNHQKEYAVKVNKDITDAFIRGMAAGVEIVDGNKGVKVTTRKCRVEKTGRRSFIIVLEQGLNRQIRRMCGAFGYEVTALRRVRIMNIRLNGLKEGGIRVLTEEEETRLRELCEYGEKGRSRKSDGED